MRLLLTGIFSLFITSAKAQFLMDMVDTTKGLGKTVFSVSQRFNHLRIGGYIQPQFQIASKEGVKNYSGGDFFPYSNNRFMLRRGRIKIDYLNLNEQEKPTVEFVFQLDGTERGFFIRDVWGRILKINMNCFLSLRACLRVRSAMN